jgi:hypothetical protein
VEHRSKYVLRRRTPEKSGVGGTSRRTQGTDGEVRRSPENPEDLGLVVPLQERKLPRKLVVAATPSQESLQLRVELQSTDTGEVKAADALLDSGATGLFLDSDYVRRQKLNTRELSHPIPVSNVDGTPNDGGPIRQVVDVVLRYKQHAERVIFAVTNLGNQTMILGLPWLREHNPEVNWKSGEVKMSRCPARCRTC